MNRHKIYNITIAVLTATLFSACSYESENVDQQAPDSSDPMRFGLYAAPTRAASNNKVLHQDFLVSAYRDVNTSQQNTVMDRYQVLYKEGTANWYNTTSASWEYISDGSNNYWQQQSVKYWNYYLFPYRFVALSPSPTKDSISEYELSESRISTPSSCLFKAQTRVNGETSKGVEPFLIAEMQRDASGGDVDLIDGDSINNASHSLNRTVILPFHHLTSLVRFAIYCDYHDLKGTKLPVSDVVIKAKKKGIVTEAGGYNVDLRDNNALEGSFIPSTIKTTDELVLLSTGSETADLSQYTSKDNAYWMGCEKGLKQIPQEGIRLYISMKVGDNTYQDIPVKMVNGKTETEVMDWEPSVLNTYYIIVTHNTTTGLSFTASLRDWKVKSGELTTDLEQ